MAESEQQDQIIQAAEYVLGTLDSRERSRFETQLMHDPGARAELAYWEQRLGALGFALEPVEPPAAIWDGLTQRLGIASVPREFDTQRTAVSGRPAANDGARSFWRGLAIAASVAAIALAAVLFSGVGERNAEPVQEVEPAYASVVYDEPTGMSWLVTAREDSDKMKVMAMGNYDVPDGKVLRLWFKADDGDPILVGKWPHTHGQYEMTVPDAAAKAMHQPAQLMVSMEDANASNPESGPSGELMWSSPIARRTG